MLLTHGGAGFGIGSLPPVTGAIAQPPWKGGLRGCPGGSPPPSLTHPGVQPAHRYTH